MFGLNVISARKPSSANSVFPNIETFKQTVLGLHRLHNAEYGIQYLQATLLCFLAVDALAAERPGAVIIQKNIESVYALIDDLIQTSTHHDPYYQKIHQSIRSLSPDQLLSCLVNTQRIYSELRCR